MYTEYINEFIEHIDSDNDKKYGLIIRNVPTTINRIKLTTCCYDSNYGSVYLRYLRKMGAKMSLKQFNNKSVLCAFIIPLQTDHSDIIIHFGFTKNIQGRMKSIISEYQCNAYFVGAKIITSKKEETAFHNMLRTRYPDNIENYIMHGIDVTSGGQRKTKLYKLCPALFEDYDNFGNDVNDEYTFALTLFNYLIAKKKIELELMELADTY